jgi:hypothetical protein
MILKPGGIKLATQLRETWIADFLVKVNFSQSSIRIQLDGCLPFFSFLPLSCDARPVALR